MKTLNTKWEHKLEICDFFGSQAVKPSLSIKISSISNFTIKLLSKLHSDLFIGVHSKGTKKFASKVINRQFFHRKAVFHMKMLSINNFTTELLTIIDYFLNGLQSLRSLLTSLIAKLLIDNISIERLNLTQDSQSECLRDGKSYKFQATANS